MQKYTNKYGDAIRTKTKVGPGGGAMKTGAEGWGIQARHLADASILKPIILHQQTICNVLKV